MENTRWVYPMFATLTILANTLSLESPSWATSPTAKAMVTISAKRVATLNQNPMTSDTFRTQFVNIKQGSETELKQLIALRDEVFEAMKVEAMLRDEAHADFDALPTGDVNSMIAKSVKKELNQKHAMNYTYYWRVWMDVKSAIETLEPTNTVGEGQMSFGF